MRGLQVAGLCWFLCPGGGEAFWEVVRLFVCWKIGRLRVVFPPGGQEHFSLCATCCISRQAFCKSHVLSVLGGDDPTTLRADRGRDRSNTLLLLGEKGVKRLLCPERRNHAVFLLYHVWFLNIWWLWRKMKDAGVRCRLCWSLQVFIHIGFQCAICCFICLFCFVLGRGSSVSKCELLIWLS